MWFVVGIPIYFYSVLSDGTEAGNRAAFFTIGTFMAFWIVGYGVVQANAPRLIGAKGKSDEDISRMAAFWVLILTVITFSLAALAWIAGEPQTWLTVSLVIGLLVFGGVFAINSAIHSYLILAFTRDDRVTMDVGFYYMSNAAGRLTGTLLSGLSFQIGGLTLCLATAGSMGALSWLAVRRL